MTEPLWHGLNHQQLWDQVHAGPGPYVSDSAATAWRNAESALQQIDNGLSTAIAKAAGWTGTAATAARSGLTPLGNWALDATGSAGRAAASLTEHQVQVAWVRANLPEPIASSDPAVLQGATAVADQAFHVMDTYAANTALIQQQVPLWTAPPAVTVSVADGPPPGGPAAASPQRAAGTFPAAVAPAAAPPRSAGPGGAAVGFGVPGHPTGAAHLPLAAVSTVTPTARGSAEPLRGGPASASHDQSAFPVLAGPVERLRPGESGVLRAGGLHGATESTRRGAGGSGEHTRTSHPSPTGGSVARAGDSRPSRADGSGAHAGTDHPRPAGGSGAHTRTGHPGPARADDGVLRGTPSEQPDPATPSAQGSPAPPHLGLTEAGGPSSGVLGSGLGTGYPGSGRGGAGFGGRPFDGRPADTGPGHARGRADPGTSVAGNSHDAAPIGRKDAAGYPGYLPQAGVGLGRPGDAHGTPGYLVGASALFADGRRLAGPVITPEEPTPPRT